MNVIDAHRDASGRPATFTFNTVMGNPDFEAIERDSFEHFHHQHLFESYRHYHGEDLEDDWRNAIDSRLIRPQFHAREHLNSPLWMADLKAGHQETRRPSARASMASRRAPARQGSRTTLPPTGLTR